MRRDHLKKSTVRFFHLIASIAAAAWSGAAAAAEARLLPTGPDTFYLVIAIDRPFSGGEVGIGFLAAAFNFVAAEPGPDFPRGASFPDGEHSIAAQRVPVSSCPADPQVTAGLVVSWIHDDLRPLPRGEHRVLTLRFSKTAGARDGSCPAFKFLRCLGVGGALVRNTITGEDGDSISLITTDTTVCLSNCRILQFAFDRTADCETLIIDLREADGIQSLARREIPVRGVTGYDAARAFFRSLEQEPVPSLTVGLLTSGVKLCRWGGEPLRIFVDERERRQGEREVLDGETIGPCGMDLTGEVPSCVDADLDGQCDAEDDCPSEYRPTQPCPAAGLCRRILFAPHSRVLCAGLALEVREPNRSTVIWSSAGKAALETGMSGLDAAREIHRAAAASPPAGFAVRRDASGLMLCRTAGTAFSVFLVHPEGGSMSSAEIDLDAATLSCGLRAWAQPRRCEDAGFADDDGDGICDPSDICPQSFNPSQADSDWDCVGDACEGSREPFVPPGLCDGVTARELQPDQEEPWTLQFSYCIRAACASFRAPPGKPVVLKLDGTSSRNAYTLLVKRGGAPTLSDNDGMSAGDPGRPVLLVIPSISEATYFVRAQSTILDDQPASATLTARSVELGLEAIVPDRGAAGGRAGVIVQGGGFEKGLTRFSLVPAAGGNTIHAEKLAVVSAGRAEVVFDLREAPEPAEGEEYLYHLEAGETGISTRIENAFRVLPPDEANGLDVRIRGQSAYRIGIESRATLTIKNTSSAEILAPLLKVTAPSSTVLRLARDADYQGGELFALGADPRGFSGRLPPGAEVEVPVILKNDDPICLSCAGEFQVHLLTPLPDDTVDWGHMPAPSGVSQDRWTVLQTTLPTVLGSTWQEVHTRLAEIATRLTRRGGDGSSVLEQLRFAARIAWGRPSAAAVGRVVDASSLGPIAEARVVALSDRQVVSSATTDGLGTFALDWLEAGKDYRLEVSGMTGGLDVRTPEAGAGGADLTVGDLLGLELRAAAGGPEREERCTGCDASDLPAGPILIPEQVLTRVARFRTRFVSSRDPNEKTGNDGEGDERYVGLGEQLIYTIYFENLANAGAAAQIVFIRDILDPDLDWQKVRLLDVNVGGRLTPLYYTGEDRSSGYRYYSSIPELEASATGLQLYPVCSEVAFSLHAVVDTTGGIVTWTFTTIDCVGVTVARDSDLGFLPPNRTRPMGQGFVTFSVPVRDDAPDNSPILNHAEVHFDGNGTYYTPEFTNVVSYFLPAERPEDPRPRPYDPAEDRRSPVTETLGWAPSKHAEKYDVYLWKDGDPTPIVVRGLTGTSISARALLNGALFDHNTPYRWQVVARNVRDVETWSEVWSFKTEQELCPLNPPANPSTSVMGCACADVVLKWDAVRYADEYEVSWGPEGQTPASTDRTSATSLHLDTTGLAPGKYAWRVVGLNQVCPTPGENEAAEGEFVVCTKAECCPANPPVNLSISVTGCACRGQDVVLKWDALELAEEYKVSWGPAGQTPASMDRTPATSMHLDTTGLAPGKYAWRVVGLNRVCPTPEENEAAEGEFSVCEESECGGPPFRRGDADGSGKLDLTDAIFTLQFLFMGGTTPTCMDAADSDDSGKLDLTDAIYSLQFQFMGGPPPAAPGPTTCGPDPTPDDQYTECIYPNC
jgi:hypothetical protein